MLEKLLTEISIPSGAIKSYQVQDDTALYQISIPSGAIKRVEKVKFSEKIK